MARRAIARKNGDTQLNGKLLIPSGLITTVDEQDTAGNQLPIAAAFTRT